MFLAAAPAALADPEPDASLVSCPYKVTTPPAVDASEVPEAGDPPMPLLRESSQRRRER